MGGLEGLVKFGRMPLHWGSGMVFNAGNGAWDEFGNSVERVQFSQQFQSVFFLVAVESYEENNINLADDTWGVVGSAYYSKSNNN